MNPSPRCIVPYVTNKSFHRAFAERCLGAVRILRNIPLTQANRPALASSARRFRVDALLAGDMALVRAFHDAYVLASAASGPGIPEGRARLDALRSALDSAERAVGLSSGEPSAGGRRADMPGCVFSALHPEHGRLVVPSSLLEAAESRGYGLRLVRFRPSYLKATPKALSETLSELDSHGRVLGLYAVPDRGRGTAPREFVLFTPDHPSLAGTEGADPLARLPVNALVRTLLPAGTGAVPDLRGLRVAPPPSRSKDRSPVSL